MRRIGWQIVCVIVLIGLHVPAHADANAEKILNAVVKIRSMVPRGAESSASLGAEREGNGVVIDAEGTILTVGYLIREAESIEVTAADGKLIDATYIGYDQATGFGLARAKEPLGVEPIALGQSSAVQVGDPILVAAYGGEEAVQAARVISRSEFAGYWEYLLDEAIYTLPASPNFSGAALINSEGKLVGIGSLFTQVLIPSLGAISCNVSVPIDLLPPILADLKATGRSGKAQRPWLGINAEESHGRIFITRVTSGGPAEKAGIKPGDIMLSVAGDEISGLSDFYRKVWAVGNAGVSVPLSALQGTKIREITVHSIDRSQRLRPKSGQDIRL